MHTRSHLASVLLLAFTSLPADVLSRAAAPTLCAGWPGVDAYYAGSSSAKRIPDVSVPLLCVQALDDPIAPAEAIPYAALEANPRCVLAATPCGGHLGWASGPGAPFGAPWTDAAVMEWLSSVHVELMKQRSSSNGGSSSSSSTTSNSTAREESAVALGAAAAAAVHAHAEATMAVSASASSGGIAASAQQQQAREFAGAHAELRERATRSSPSQQWPQPDSKPHSDRAAALADANMLTTSLRWAL